MHDARWFLLAAVATHTLLATACGGDDSSENPIDAGGSAGAPAEGGGGAAGGKGDANGSGGSAGSDGSAGAAKDGGTGGTAGSGRDGSTEGGGGSSGTGGAAGTSIDAGSGGTTIIDAPADGMGGARPDASNDASRPDGGNVCMSGPVMGMTCTDYCSGWFGTCQPIAMWSSIYATPAACMTACSSWNDTKLCCRAEQVHNAVLAPNPNQAERHCGRAVGVDGPAPCSD